MLPCPPASPFLASANDSDPDNGDSLHVCQINGQPINQGSGLTLALTRTIDSDPNVAGGTLVLDSDGCYTFSTGTDFEDLAVGEIDEVCFSYFICDEAEASDEAQVCIEVAGKNDPPAAEDDSETTTEDSPVSYSSILDNDFDVDGDTLTVKSVEGMDLDLAAGTDITFSLPTGALVTVSATGEYTFDPNGQYDYLAEDDHAIETFQYAVTDGNDGTAEATVTILIKGVNDPPVARDDAYTRGADEADPTESPLTGNILEENDFDPDAKDGEVLTITGVTSTDGSVLYAVPDDWAHTADPITFELSNGTVVLYPNGTVEYTPDEAKFDQLSQGEIMVDSFQYTIKDANGLMSAPATVTFTTTGKNDPPAAADNSETVDEGGEVSDCIR